MKQVAVRNLRLCTKDCLCLYICPTGATDTEDSVIDVAKCLGCGVCAAACPSGAISMVPETYPPQQEKNQTVLDAAYPLAKSKAAQESIARQLAETAREDTTYRLMTAVAKSIRLVNEDLLRESGYMLPQSRNTHDLLQQLITAPPAPDFPVVAAEKLLKMIPCNEESEGQNMNKYAGTQTEKNLETAFAGESQARNKYTYFASVAKREGYEQIAALFLKTEEN